MKKFFRKIVAFLANLFTNLDEWIHEHVQPSIEMVERIKAIVASPVGDLITALIPGDWDDKLRQMAIANLTRAIDAMHITSEISSEPDWTSKAAKLLAYLRNQSKPMQRAVYKQLAAELAKQSAFGKQLAAELEAAEKEGREPNAVATEVKGHSVDLLVQLQYSKLKEKVSAADLPDADPFLVAAAPVLEPTGGQEPEA